MANEIITANQDIDYIEKDYSSVVDALITYATVNYGSGTSANRLWTDFNADSFSRTWLEIVAYVSDVLFFYLDNQATQSYLQTATIRSAVEDIAAQFGYVPATNTSASGVATFTTTGAGTIPKGFKVAATNGAEFYLTAAITASGAQEIDGNVIQGEEVVDTFVAEGLQNEEFDLSKEDIIVDQSNSSTSLISPVLTVNGNEYTLVNTFIWQNGTDTDAITDSLGNVIGGGGRVYDLKERDSGIPYIMFGDGEFGRKLVSGDTISITYRNGGGSIGNISKDTLTTLVDSNIIVSSVTNNADFSGGADEQSINRLRELIPASLRTLERAVAEQDYSDILKANFNEVFDASTEQNKKDPGVDLNVYVIPSGSGIASITDNVVLYNQLVDFLNRRKMVTVQYSILDAYGIDFIIELEIFVGSTISRSTTVESINTALKSFFDLDTGGSDGSGMGFAKQVLLKDIMDVIEDVDGITRFEIKKLTYRPRIAEDIVSDLTSYHNSDVTIFNNVSESEWLNVASGALSETPNVVLFNNNSSPRVAFSYSSVTGVLQYANPVDLALVAPGDFFRDTSDANWPILGVDTINYNLTLDDGLGVDDAAPTTDDHGSIRNGSTEYEAFKCFKKTISTTTNLAVNSITDNNLDLALISGTCVSLDDNLVLDNSKVLIQDEYATGDYYFIDAADNIWSIVSNESNTITTGPNAINDSAIMAVVAGNYDVVKNLTGYQVVFNENIFDVQYNTKDTLFSVSAQFSQIGTIGDTFDIVEVQDNIGVLGESLDLLSTSIGGSGETIIKLNSSPNLIGISSEWSVIDSSGQIFNVVGVDDRQQPLELYSSSNKSASFLLEGSGAGNQVGQGFKVSETGAYAAVNLYLRREGNIQGSLILRVLSDNGTGVPDLGSVLATSVPVNVINVATASKGIDSIAVDGTVFDKVTFTFAVPPTLTAGSPYHIALEGDGTYDGLETSNIVIMADPTVNYTYNSGTGVITYVSTVDLSTVLPGHYFEDDDGDLFLIISVDDAGDELVISDNEINFTAGNNSRIIQNDRVLVGIDNSSPTYQSAVLFSNSGLESFSYVSGTGVVTYGGVVDLSSAEAGNFFKDGAGNIFKILSVDDPSDEVTLDTGLTINNTVNDSSDGSIVESGGLTSYDGFIWTYVSPDSDAVFTVEGTKTITVDSNLTPELGTGAIVSKRYYDDSNEVSFILGLSEGVPTSASDANAAGQGTVSGEPNSSLDTFTFRTSRIADDVINLRLNEVPQISTDDVNILIFGGVE